MKFWNKYIFLGILALGLSLAVFSNFSLVKADENPADFTCLAGTISCHGPYTNYDDPDFGEPYCYLDCTCDDYYTGEQHSWTSIEHAGTCEEGDGSGSVDGVCGTADQRYSS